MTSMTLSSLSPSACSAISLASSTRAPSGPSTRNAGMGPAGSGAPSTRTDEKNGRVADTVWVSGAWCRAGVVLSVRRRSWSWRGARVRRNMLCAACVGSVSGKGDARTRRERARGMWGAAQRQAAPEGHSDDPSGRRICGAFRPLDTSTYEILPRKPPASPAPPSLSVLRLKLTAESLSASSVDGAPRAPRFRRLGGDRLAR